MMMIDDRKEDLIRERAPATLLPSRYIWPNRYFQDY